MFHSERTRKSLEYVNRNANAIVAFATRATATPRAVEPDKPDTPDDPDKPDATTDARAH